MAVVAAAAEGGFGVAWSIGGADAAPALLGRRGQEEPSKRTRLPPRRPLAENQELVILFEEKPDLSLVCHPATPRGLEGDAVQTFRHCPNP